MAKLKTWKRWGHFQCKELYGNAYDLRFAGQHPVRVVREADYRKMRAVYNAAIKWSRVPAGDDRQEMIALCKACERARK